jgi:thioredoxin-like negative regulator of GroEL
MKHYMMRGHRKDKMMKKLLLFVALSAATIGVQAKEPVDNLGVQAISVADYSTAEARLTEELRRDPGLPEALLNLAHVYRATGRNQAATKLYKWVLSSPEVELLVGQTEVTSHELARRALAGPQSLAALR